jgi:hypothetical protein
VIDLLCLDSQGDVAIVELKRDKTSREVTAQTLDYASWVKDLSNERITKIADRYLGEAGPLEQAFENRFRTELPETLNEQHKMLVVASEIDASTERIINYLSDTYGVDINAVTFQYMCGQDERQYLARLFLIEPAQVEYSARTRTGSKRRRNLTYQEMEALAEEKGVGDLYRQLLDGLSQVFDSKNPTVTTVSFSGNMEGRMKVIFALEPGKSAAEKGVRFYIYKDRLLSYIGADKEGVIALLPPGWEERIWWEGGPLHWVGFFGASEQIGAFLEGVREFKSNTGN